MIAFRKKHLLALLEGYDTAKAPIDFYVSSYFRAHKALGSKDRAYIAEMVYSLIRWKALIDFCLTSDTICWNDRLNWQEMHSPKDFLQDATIPEHIRVSFPEDLYAYFKNSLQTHAFAVALASNEQAPTCLRVNTLKITVDDFVKRLQQKGFVLSKAEGAESGVYIHQKCNFFVLPEFKEGLFEVQDEASQIVAQMCHVKAHESVLDFCAGSGGKALAFAPFMQKTGQIFLHDVRPHALKEAKKRLKRAGIQNAQVVDATDTRRLEMLKKKMDWVFVDAPCTGTGTLRRNPDMKWKFSKEMLQRLIGEQRTIFEKALSFVKINGHIIYATCSVLKEENSEQMEHFLQTFPIEIEGVPFQSFPESGKKDGFFAVCFRKIERKNKA